MRRAILSIGSIIMLTVFVATLASVPVAAQSPEKVLHSFLGGSDGIAPYAGVVFDSAGRLYGTTCQGGTYGSGVVYQMGQKSGGVWSEHVIHTFNAADGNCPSSSLIVDKSGNVYGTAPGGGRYNSGVVFELIAPTTGGGWGYRILHSFSNNGLDGQVPFGGLVMDSAGKLYGTTQFGPNKFYGTVFELSPTGGGSWNETILYSFPINSSGFMVDGAQPQGSLIFDAAGNLYGATNGGGAYGFGTVFELSPSGSGTWTESILHSFLNTFSADIWTLQGGVVFDKSGNLYGCTEAGGADNDGGIFELSPAGDGTWTETILHTFTGGTNGSKDGAVCNWETPVFDSAGNLYGVTSYGGANSAGTVWKLTAQSGGAWAYSTIYSFKNINGDGVNPASTLAFDSHGNLFGSTLSGGPGGDSGYGTVFVVKP
ncbi:MAG TPA: choice-of-anchor tandem repeat GloVer-containing protein [Candidatus Sulfotelmatobacter sp.]|nr:choice-of-anchor tandem repeat GloVer-containing protein [Candidatus Sulfotelmatobacter sp.]